VDLINHYSLFCYYKPIMVHQGDPVEIQNNRFKVSLQCRMTVLVFAQGPITGAKEQ